MAPLSSSLCPLLKSWSRCFSSNSFIGLSAKDWARTERVKVDKFHISTNDLYIAHIANQLHCLHSIVLLLYVAGHRHTCTACHKMLDQQEISIDSSTPRQDEESGTEGKSVGKDNAAIVKLVQTYVGKGYDITRTENDLANVNIIYDLKLNF